MEEKGVLVFQPGQVNQFKDITWLDLAGYEK